MERGGCQRIACRSEGIPIEGNGLGVRCRVCGDDSVPSGPAERWGSLKDSRRGGDGSPSLHGRFSLSGGDSGALGS